MSPSPIDFLKHIADEINYISERTAGVSESEFFKDETLKRATVRSLEIIGEASKKIPDQFKNRYPHVEWKQMAGMRDKLIHDYMGVDYWIVPTLDRAPPNVAADCLELRYKSPSPARLIGWTGIARSAITWSTCSLGIR